MLNAQTHVVAMELVERTMYAHASKTGNPVMRHQETVQIAHVRMILHGLTSLLAQTLHTFTKNARAGVSAIAKPESVTASMDILELHASAPPAQMTALATELASSCLTYSPPMQMVFKST
jgi:hypothetical protein